MAFFAVLEIDNEFTACGVVAFDLAEAPAFMDAESAWLHSF